MKKIIKNGKVFDGISNNISQLDILIEDGVIQDTGNIEISDPEARLHVYGMSYEDWKKKNQK